MVANVVSEVASPLQLVLTTSSVSTNRPVDMLTPLSLRITGGFVLNSLGTGAALSQLSIGRLGKLDRRLLREGFDSIEFQRRFQDVVNAIESAINALNTQVNSNTAVIAALQAASTQAQAANDNATAVGTRTSIEGSYPDPTKVLTASGDGTITISAHKRRYTDGTFASVNAGSVSGLANEVLHTVFYRDAAREGGAVTYEVSTMVVAQADNIHVVGRVEVPASGAANATGDSPTAPGVPPPPDFEVPQDYEIF